MSQSIKDDIQKGNQMDKQMMMKNLSSSELRSKSLITITAKILQINIKTFKKHWIANSIKCYWFNIL